MMYPRRHFDPSLGAASLLGEHLSLEFENQLNNYFITLQIVGVGFCLLIDLHVALHHRNMSCG